MTDKLHPLHIGIVLSGVGVVQGGLETQAVDFALGLSELGHRVTLISGFWPGRLRVQLSSALIRRIRVPCVPMDSAVWRLKPVRVKPRWPINVQSFSFAFVSRLRPIVRTALRTCDVTVTFLGAETNFVSAWRHRLGRPNVSYFPGPMGAKEMSRDRSTLRVALSETVANRARGHLDIDGVVQPALRQEWLKTDYTVRMNARRLLYVGRLEDNKGVRELLEIINGVATVMSDIRLTIIGDGQRRKWIEKETSRRGLRVQVTCVGAQSRERVRRELHQSDLFIFPSHYESFGISVLEALAVGVPVICSDTAGLQEVVSGSAITIPHTDTDRWVATILRLLDDPEARCTLSTRGQERVAQLPWSATITALERFLYQAIEISNRRES